MKELTLDQVQELQNFLAEGILPAGIGMKSKPKLGKKKAFNVIWLLQEYFRMIPKPFTIGKVSLCKRVKEQTRQIRLNFSKGVL